MVVTFSKCLVNWLSNCNKIFTDITTFTISIKTVDRKLEISTADLLRTHLICSNLLESI